MEVGWPLLNTKAVIPDKPFMDLISLVEHRSLRFQVARFMVKILSWLRSPRYSLAFSIYFQSSASLLIVVFPHLVC